jgi:hypothetical protein
LNLPEQAGFGVYKVLLKGAGEVAEHIDAYAGKHDKKNGCVGDKVPQECPGWQQPSF